jgi:hypothetical protein
MSSRAEFLADYFNRRFAIHPRTSVNSGGADNHDPAQDLSAADYRAKTTFADVSYRRRRQSGDANLRV